MKVYYNKKAFKGYRGGMTETVLCMPFEDSNNWPEEPLHNNRFEPIFKLPQEHLQYTSLQECDFAILPYKYEDTAQTQQLVKEANESSKKILVFYNDDDEGPLNLSPEQGYVFRTSLNAHDREINELAFPAFVGDFYHESFLITDLEKQKTIGFCGQALTPLRRKVIQKLRKQNTLKTDFILRHGFWAPEIPKEQARKDFLDNMKNNLFNVCIRGAGNFSYRLYETLMMGRIPLIINSNQVFPFDKLLNYNDFSIVIQEDEITNIDSIINEWFLKNQNNLSQIQIHNRNIWEKYMSPEGWVKQFRNEINSINKC